MDHHVTAVAGTIDLASVFDRVQGRPYPPVPSRMDVALVSAALQVGQKFREFPGLPEELSSLARPVRVGLEHCGGPRFDHVVDVELDRSYAETVVVVLGHLFGEGLKVGFRRPDG